MVGRMVIVVGRLYAYYEMVLLVFCSATQQSELCQVKTRDTYESCCKVMKLCLGNTNADGALDGFC